MLKRLFGVVGVVSIFAAGAPAQTVGGQPEQDAAATQPAEPAPPARPAPPKDDQLDALMAMLSGSWKTQGKEPESGEAVELWMHVAPIACKGIDRALYAEFHRAGDIDRPYRQAVYEFYRFKGNVRLRTLEFRRAERTAVLAGLWPAPDVMPTIDRADLIATLDVELKPSAAGWSGKTPYPYPTAERGAVEMTSEVTLSADSLRTVDRGYAGSGSLAWGDDAGYTWERADPGVSVERRDNGLIIIDLVRPEGERTTKDGDVAVIHYTGWLADGTSIQSTRQGNVPYRTNLPFVGIQAWTEGLIGITEGTRRRLIAPPALAFGEEGRGPIPPNSTMYFEIELLKIEDPVQPEQPAPPGEAGEAGGGGDGDGGGGDATGDGPGL